MQLRKVRVIMVLRIDFNSNEAIYMQLRNQIIFGIATEDIKEGDSLPSVRQLAEEIGINMHTVNKAYAVLKDDGFLKLDRRRGAIVAFDIDKLRSMEELKIDLRFILAKAMCRGISEDEAHDIVSQIYHEFL